MLPQLQAEQQLLAIEAASVPHMKPEDGRRVVERHAKVLRPKPERPKRLTEAFLTSGMTVVEVPTAKRQRKRRDKLGQAGRAVGGEA